MTYIGDLFNKYGSDKDKNGYSPYYDALFGRIRFQITNVAEIGIGTMIPGVCSSMVGYSLPGYAPGGSLRAWADYFPNALICGFDVQPDTQFEAERIRTYLHDSRKPLVMSQGRSWPSDYFDIIIDDGSHLDQDQLMTLQNFYPLLRDGGFYVIEDIYPGSRIFGEMMSVIKTAIGPDSRVITSADKNLLCISKDATSWRR